MSPSLHSCLVNVALLLLFLGSVRPQGLQCTPDNRREHFSIENAELYLEMERQLVVGQHALLEAVRAIMLTDTLDAGLVQLKIQVVTGPESTCSGANDSAFCHVSNHVNYTSQLCLSPLEFQYFTPSFSERASARSTYLFVTWSTLVHGDWLSFIIRSITIVSPPEEIKEHLHITLQLDRLRCNPSQAVLVCAVDELFSWVRHQVDYRDTSCVHGACTLLLSYYSLNIITQAKLYVEFGGRPKTWDRKQKGYTSLNSEAHDSFDVRAITNLVPDKDTLLNLCLTEYVFVSLSLALVIAKFFPAIHSQLVSRATSLESQSLYWGAAVVSNVLVYGLVLVGGKGFSLYLLHHVHPPTVYAASVLQVISYCILLVTSLLTRENAKANVPIPKGMAKYIINASFCFTFFCCCVCSSKHCRGKTLRVLVLFSFMLFIYHSAMQGIAVGFALLVNVPITVTLSALYILSLLFPIILVYFLTMVTADLTNLKGYQQALKVTLNAIIFVCLFAGVLLIIFVYVLMTFKLQPGGTAGVVSALVPPVILSAAGWYVKKKLLITDNSEVTSPENKDESHPIENNVESTV